MSTRFRRISTKFRKISLDTGDNGEKTPDNPDKPEYKSYSDYLDLFKNAPETTFHQWYQGELDSHRNTTMTHATDPTKGRNPDNGCQCDTCLIFQTPMGQATLQWARSLTKAVRQGLELGADPTAEMSFSLMGPTARAFAGGAMDNQQYATINMVLQDAATRASILTEPVPDWSHLREEYDMDPAITALLDWMDRRLSR